MGPRLHQDAFVYIDDCMENVHNPSLIIYHRFTTFFLEVPGSMRVTICDSKKELGVLAAREGASCIRQAIADNGEANVVFVTGKSQVETLLNLAKQDVDWSQVNVFHLDEFVGLKKDSLSSSKYFLQEFFLSHIGQVKSYTPIDTDEASLEKTVNKLNRLMASHKLDVAFICIGENGHLAFNDPPADFDTRDPYIVVDLEKRSRRQQVSEGWFSSLDDVPAKAVTMSVSEILSARHIIVSCPDQRKAKAVASCLFDDVTVLSPSSALRMSYDCSLYLDRLSSALVFADGRRD